MRSLLDVNVLIALFDPDHVFHEKAHVWWKEHAGKGWASCPLTENGMVRVMANVSYSSQARFAPPDLIDRMHTFAQATDHEFWPDSLSLRDPTWFLCERILSGRTLTDLYLLALATSRGARLATFDASIPLSVIPSAKPDNLTVL